MDFRRLTYFCAIVEEGSISAAARRLNISQPPLSSRLKELEEEVGLPLIDRADGRWTVTEAGQQLYQRGQFLLNELDRLVADIQEYSLTGKGQFSLAVTYAAYYYVQPRLAELLEKNPQISAKLLVTDDSGVEKAVQNCSADIGVVLAPLQFNNYKARRIMQSGYIVVASDKVQLPDKEELSPGDLINIPLLLLARWEGIPIKNLMIRSAFKALGSTPVVRMETPDPHHIVDMLLSGVEAVGIIHTSYLSQHSIPLQWRKFSLPELSDEMILIHRKELFINGLFKDVINTLLRKDETSAKGSGN